MVSGLLRLFGVPMGEHVNDANNEDEEFLSARGTRRQLADPEARNAVLVDLIRLFRSRNERHPVWGWKDPLAPLYIRDVFPLMRNPRFLVIFRDPFAVALNQNRHSGRDIVEGLQNALETFHDIRDFIRETGKKLMVLLSFSRARMIEELTGRPRFDQSLLDWMRQKSFPVVDFRDSFRNDYGLYKADVETYLDRYYIGHHSPAGNFFSAWALKDPVCRWLDPAPIPYR